MKKLELKIYKRKNGYKAIIIEEDFDFKEKSCVLESNTITDILYQMESYLKDELNYTNAENYLMSWKKDLKELLSNKDIFAYEKICHIDLINKIYKDKYIIIGIEEMQNVKCEVCDYHEVEVYE